MIPKSSLLDKDVLANIGDDDQIYIVTHDADGNNKRDKRVPIKTLETRLFGNSPIPNFNEDDSLFLVNKMGVRHSAQVSSLVNYMNGLRDNDHVLSRTDSIYIADEGDGGSVRKEIGIDNLADYLLGDETISDPKDVEGTMHLTFTDDKDARDTRRMISFEDFLRYSSTASGTNGSEWYSFNSIEDYDRTITPVEGDRKLVANGVGLTSYIADSDNTWVQVDSLSIDNQGSFSYSSTGNNTIKNLSVTDTSIFNNVIVNGTLVANNGTEISGGQLYVKGTDIKGWKTNFILSDDNFANVVQFRAKLNEWSWIGNDFYVGGYSNKVDYKFLVKASTGDVETKGNLSVAGTISGGDGGGSVNINTLDSTLINVRTGISGGSLTTGDLLLKSLSVDSVAGISMKESSPEYRGVDLNGNGLSFSYDNDTYHSNIMLNENYLEYKVSKGHRFFSSESVDDTIPLMYMDKSYVTSNIPLRVQSYMTVSEKLYANGSLSVTGQGTFSTNVTIQGTLNATGGGIFSVNHITSREGNIRSYGSGFDYEPDNDGSYFYVGKNSGRGLVHIRHDLFIGRTPYFYTDNAKFSVLGDTGNLSTQGNIRAYGEVEIDSSLKLNGESSYVSHRADDVTFVTGIRTTESGQEPYGWLRLNNNNKGSIRIQGHTGSGVKDLALFDVATGNIVNPGLLDTKGVRISTGAKKLDLIHESYLGSNVAKFTLTTTGDPGTSKYGFWVDEGGTTGNPIEIMTIGYNSITLKSNQVSITGGLTISSNLVASGLSSFTNDVTMSKNLTVSDTINTLKLVSTILETPYVRITNTGIAPNSMGGLLSGRHYGGAVVGSTGETDSNTFFQSFGTETGGNKRGFQLSADSSGNGVKFRSLALDGSTWSIWKRFTLDGETVVHSQDSDKLGGLSSSSYVRTDANSTIGAGYTLFLPTLQASSSIITPFLETTKIKFNTSTISVNNMKGIMSGRYYGTANNAETGTHEGSTYFQSFGGTNYSDSEGNVRGFQMSVSHDGSDVKFRALSAVTEMWGAWKRFTLDGEVPTTSENSNQLGGVDASNYLRKDVSQVSEGNITTTLDKMIVTRLYPNRAGYKPNSETGLRGIQAAAYTSSGEYNTSGISSPLDYVMIMNLGYDDQLNGQFMWNYDNGNTVLSFRKMHAAAQSWNSWNRIQFVGDKATDSDKLDGKTSDEFASIAHTHGSIIGIDNITNISNFTRTVGTLAFNSFANTTVGAIGVTNNANGVITMHTHAGTGVGYTHQLLFVDATDGMYHRSSSNGTYRSWRRLVDSTEISNFASLSGVNAFTGTQQFNGDHFGRVSGGNWSFIHYPVASDYGGGAGRGRTFMTTDLLIGVSNSTSWSSTATDVGHIGIHLNAETGSIRTKGSIFTYNSSGYESYLGIHTKDGGYGYGFLARAGGYVWARQYFGIGGGINKYSLTGLAEDASNTIRMYGNTGAIYANSVDTSGSLTATTALKLHGVASAYMGVAIGTSDWGCVIRAGGYGWIKNKLGLGGGTNKYSTDGTAIGSDNRIILDGTNGKIWSNGSWETTSSIKAGSSITGTSFLASGNIYVNSKNIISSAGKGQFFTGLTLDGINVSTASHTHGRVRTGNNSGAIQIGTSSEGDNKVYLVRAKAYSTGLSKWMYASTIVAVSSSNVANKLSVYQSSIQSGQGYPGFSFGSTGEDSASWISGWARITLYASNDTFTGLEWYAQEINGEHIA